MEFEKFISLVKPMDESDLSKIRGGNGNLANPIIIKTPAPRIIIEIPIP